MTPIGRRDTLIAFARATTAQDAAGEDVETWEPLEHGEWARVFWGRGDERRAAAMTQGAQPATFVCLDNPMTGGVKIRDRVVWGGNWDIQGIARPNRGEIEFSAVRAP